MECENVFCLYQKNNKCTLRDVSIDVSGRCSDCIYIDIDDKTIEDSKRKLLSRYEC